MDNCYGGIYPDREPVSVGRILMSAKPHKNFAGGGMRHRRLPFGTARSGGALRLMTDRARPRAELGCPFGDARFVFGALLCPRVTPEALKTSIYASRFFDCCVIQRHPCYRAERNDIITSIENRQLRCACAGVRGIQAGSPVTAL